MARLVSLTPDDFTRSSRHPRLGTTIGIIDMMLFHAEHDDHHLARCREIIAVLGAAEGDSP